MTFTTNNFPFWKKSFLALNMNPTLQFFYIQSGIVNAEQILCYRIPPGRLGNFKKRLCRMDAGSRQIVYVYFQNPTYPRDFTGIDFLIF